MSYLEMMWLCDKNIELCATSGILKTKLNKEKQIQGEETLLSIFFQQKTYETFFLFSFTQE